MVQGLQRPSVFLGPIAAAILLVSGSSGYSFPDCVNGPLANNTVCDISKDAITRATALIDLWTDTELLANLVDGSPGVARLGLPPYEWWSEGLVRFVPLLGVTSVNPVDFRTAWDCSKPRSQLCILRQLQLCHVLPPTYSHGCRLRRRSDPGSG